MARGHVAALIGADPKEIVWTSGATESNNLAIKGAAHFYSRKGKHVVTCKTEHKAVLDCVSAVERRGGRVTVVPVGRDGLVDPDQVRAAFTDHTVLVSVMLGNNEIGTLHPVAAIGGA